MAQRDTVVIGGSAGGLDALKKILSSLEAPFPAALLIVLHIAPGRNLLARILGRYTTLRVSTARDGEPIAPGRVYIAPADRHLLIDDGRVRLTRGPRENRARPAVDTLFRSAALHRSRRAIGVILSGMLDDGTAGLWSIKDRKGVAIVQRPDDAACPSMPESALANVAVDYSVRAEEIGPLVSRLVRESVAAIPEPPASDQLVIETAIANEAHAMKLGSFELGNLSPYSCPDCHGVLSQVRESGILRFRCHTGHAYSADSLLASLTESTENTLWSAVRAMEERMVLLEHMTQHLVQCERTAEAATVRQEIGQLDEEIDQVRKVLLRRDAVAPEVRKEA